jgi:nucleotide-binding universal stress UspA family protein
MAAHDELTPRVVVGVDGSDESKLALRWALVIATSYDAAVVAVAAWQYPSASGWGPTAVEWNPEQDMDTCLTQTVDEVFGAQRPEHLHLSVRQGNAAQVLIAESQGASMLVVGSRGHGGFAGLLLGSVSANVAEHAHCPVLVIHGDEDPMKVPA